MNYPENYLELYIGQSAFGEIESVGIEVSLVKLFKKVTARRLYIAFVDRTVNFHHCAVSNDDHSR